jgi:hypothetical protein
MKKKIIVALLLLGFPFTANADMISDEEEALRIKFEEQLRRCSHLDKSRQRSECNVKVRNKWDTARNLLKENPDLYFENKYGRKSSSPGKQKSEPPTIIHGEWDNKGNHYTPAGGGNAWRSDGTFMQKAAGGYIDTKTGKFIPTN